MTISVQKLETVGEYAKFTLNIAREANFTECPATYPFVLESVIEWEVMIELLDEFYQDDFAYQLSHNQKDDDERFNYPLWYDGESWHESETIDKWIERGDTKEFALQFVEKNKATMLNEVQYDFKAEMKIVNRSKKAA